MIDKSTAPETEGKQGKRLVPLVRIGVYLKNRIELLCMLAALCLTAVVISPVIQSVLSYLYGARIMVYVISIPVMLIAMYYIQQKWCKWIAALALLLCVTALYGDVFSIFSALSLSNWVASDQTTTTMMACASLAYTSFIVLLYFMWNKVIEKEYIKALRNHVDQKIRREANL
ncbi:hypothetical protein ACFFGV_20725 [Pontibacillus salicampi]|uniref:Uncharacterized protein n=1 Tax=Pontibacillus salicampi TaxID=1449801 RepID=A0ABV6LUU3_9BACI